MLKQVLVFFLLAVAYTTAIFGIMGKRAAEEGVKRSVGN